MIIFRTLKYKNFLSAGNAFTRFDLNKNKTTLICGDNGSGKSILLDALTYVLFNKSFRRINKPQLINSVNNKDSVVEIEFSVSNTHYKVIRGQKPNIFEIWKNGDLQEQTADLKDYQNLLEKNILKMNYKTFCQVVILGSANFVPFMMLPAAGRREIIEGLLDIELFSTMNTIVKENIKATEEGLYDLETQQKILENTIKLNIKHSKQIEKMKSQSEGELIREIANTDELISLTKKQIADIEKQLNDYFSVLDQEEELLEQISNNKYHISDNSKDRVSLEKTIDFYNHSSVCSTCEQNIDKQFKEEKLQRLAEEKNSLEIAHEHLLNTSQKLLKNKEILDQQKQQKNSLENEVLSLKTRLETQVNSKKKLSSDLEKLRTTSYELVDNTKEKEELRGILRKKKQYIEERDIDAVAALLLKDSGIKSQIIRQYIPVINQMINTNLAHLEFFCMFEFDENFNEVIKSRYRDEFSYASFSQGERMRIDLALLFTFRDLAKMRNASPCNLLILDEIMDSSLDAAGTDEFLKIIDTFAEYNNTFIISHKHHQLTDKFSNVIRIEKKKNFSRKVG